MKKSSPFFTRLAVTVFCGTALLLGGCQTNKPEPKQAQAEAVDEERPVVDVLVLKKRPFAKNKRMPGELLPSEAVDIHPKIEGFIEAIYVDRGSTVHKGQLLAKLSIPEMEAQVAEARAQVQSAAAEQSEAKAKYLADLGQSRRFQEAAQTPGVISASELETAKMTSMASLANVHSMENTRLARLAKVSALRKMSNYLQITAPINGIVTQRLLHPGALVGPNSVEPIVRLQQIDRLRLVVSVPERYYGGIKTGARIPFKVSAYPGTQFYGTIRRPSFNVDPKNRTETVELDVVNFQRSLSPGMYAEVQWPVSRTGSTFIVPASSIVSTTERVFVNRIRNGKVDWVDVERGYANGDQVEVFGELHEDDQIVKLGSDEFKAGMLVEAHQ